jgi:hypothetical protein
MRIDGFAQPRDGSGEKEPEPMDLLAFLQSSPLAEAVAAGELDPDMFERPREIGREISFDSEDLDG